MIRALRSGIRRLQVGLHRQILQRLGVTVGEGVVCHGLPIVGAARNSHIRIGSGTVLTSTSRKTALGVSRRVIMRTLLPGASIVIGTDVGMSGAVLCAAISIRIGDRCLLGADVSIVDTDFHPIDLQSGRRYAPIPRPAASDAVVIEEDVFIGSGAIVLKGVRIGRGSVVGAHSVVTANVPPDVVVAGNPARIVRPLRGGSR
jgi:acetyltransferase-like isoleucine patch superfamily enzyme